MQETIKLNDTAPLSIIIPVYNEELGIRGDLEHLTDRLCYSGLLNKKRTASLLTAVDI